MPVGMVLPALLVLSLEMLMHLSECCWLSRLAPEACMDAVVVRSQGPVSFLQSGWLSVPCQRGWGSGW